MHDYIDIIGEIKVQVNNGENDYWKSMFCSINKRSVHLAIMIEPYLSLILNGSKTIESRMSKNMISPHHQVNEGDLIILKKSGGPVTSIFEAGAIHFFLIRDSFSIEDLKAQYNDRLLIEDDFWLNKNKCNYATLIEIKHVYKLEPIYCHIPNRRSWIVLSKNTLNEVPQMSFYNIQKKYTTAHIICITGKVASGKTILSAKIAKKLNCNHYSVSDFLKEKARIQGHHVIDRKLLQKLGSECIDQGWDNFAQDFLSFAKFSSHEHVVIDGIRHKEFYFSLKKIAPATCSLIYLDANDDIIKKRLIARGEIDVNYSHVAEGNVAELKNMSDIIIDAEDNNADFLPNELEQFILCKIKRSAVR